MLLDEAVVYIVPLQPSGKASVEKSLSGLSLRYGTDTITNGIIGYIVVSILKFISNVYNQFFHRK